MRLHALPVPGEHDASARRQVYAAVIVFGRPRVPDVNTLVMCLVLMHGRDETSRDETSRDERQSLRDKDLLSLGFIFVLDLSPESCLERNSLALHPNDETCTHFDGTWAKEPKITCLVVIGTSGSA